MVFKIWENIQPDSPIRFEMAAAVDSDDLGHPVMQAEVRARRCFLGDDVGGREDLAGLPGIRDWRAFEVVAGDRLTALPESLLREILPTALEWRAEPAAASSTFEPYRASGAHLLLHIRPGSWVDITIDHD